MILCSDCGHERLHHYGPSDGITPPKKEPHCWVWVLGNRGHKCKCRGWNMNEESAVRADYYAAVASPEPEAER